MKKMLLTILITMFVSVCMGASNLTSDFSVNFDCGKEIVKFVDEKYTADNHIIYEEIISRKINSPISEKKKEVLRLIEEGKSEKTAVLSCFPALQKTYERIYKMAYVEPIDSNIKFSPDKSTMFTVSREKYGEEVSEEDFYSDFVCALFLGKTNIKIKMKKIKPSLTVKDNENYLYKKATYSTSVETSTASRKHNIELALSSINGTVLKKGETMSFNTKTGIRNEENGYKTAKIIVGNEYVDGVGGGVCQASTTLYNCALLAGLEVLSVNSHSLLPSYVEPSFDAMVNMGSSDLVIKNNSGGPVFIKAQVENGKATVTVYGRKNEYDIRKRSKTVYKGEVPEDKTVYDSENKYFSVDEKTDMKRVSFSQPKIKSEGYLVYYKNGVKQKEVLIREDVYNSKRGILAYRVENKNDAVFFCIII